MKKTRKKILHALLLLSFVGAVSLALNAGRSLRAEDAPPPAPAVTPAAPAAAEPVVVNEATEKAEFVGAESCANCHADQVESFKSAQHARGFAKQKNIEFEKSCETCHGPGSLHVNAGGDKTNPGFATMKDPKKLSAKAVSETCFQCHKDTGRSHWKGSAHERADVSCLECHSVHNAKSKHAGLIQKNASETCYQCHKDVKAQMRRSAHMPVEEGKMDCSSCHDSHGSGTPKQLKASSTNQLCYGCHQDKRGPFVWDHMPVRENCSNCHHPHGSHYDKMLIAKQPFLCQRCHAYTRHPGTLYDGNDAKNQRSQIFGQSCYACHSNIHGSNHPAGKALTR